MRRGLSPRAEEPAKGSERVPPTVGRDQRGPVAPIFPAAKWESQTRLETFTVRSRYSVSVVMIMAVIRCSHNVYFMSHKIIALFYLGDLSENINKRRNHEMAALRIASSLIFNYLPLPSLPPSAI